MKICRVSQTYPTKVHNGIGLHAYHISNAIVEPTLILTKATAEEYQEHAQHVEVYPVGYFQVPFPQYSKNLIRFSVALFSFFVGQFQFLLKSIPVLWRFRPEITHLQAPHAVLIGLFNKVMFGSKLVVTFHGSDFVRVKKIPIFFRLLNGADKVFFVSETMRETLEKYFSKEKLLQTNSGVDLGLFKNAWSERKKILISVGNLRWQKGYLFLLEALVDVSKVHPDFKMYIIGSGPEEQIIREKISQLGLQDHVSLLGQLPADQICNWMNVAKLFVLSSVTEGMPKVVLESLACGLPVVATDVGSVPELIKGCGLIVPKEDPVSLAQGIIKMLEDPDLYTQCAVNCSKNVERYSWSEAAQKIQREFVNLLRSPG